MNIDLRKGDCLELMKDLPDKSIDAIIADLPYGTTACKWDTIIPFDKLWEQYKRVIKDNGAIVLTASQPFTSALVMSNPKWFKYTWVWQKSRAANGMIARYQPLKYHEDVLIFGKGRVTYNPQGIILVNEEASQGGISSDIMGNQKRDRKYIKKFTNYPSTIQPFKSEGETIHPTQKPVPLLEYLIKTHTDEGETVLDNTMGSGTTGVACVNTNRNFIGMELDDKYFEIAKARINEATTAKQLQLF